jgi:hypothetical protein
MVNQGFPYGRFRAVSSPELLDFIERTFVLPAPEAAREEVRQEALAELTAAELELAAGDEVISRAGAQVWVRVDLPAHAAQAEEFTFEKAPGVTVRVERRGPDVLVAFQASKPTIEFRRIA